MKKIITICFAAFIVLCLFTTSCKKTSYSDIGESISVEKNLIGNWKLDSIIQVDQTAADKGFPTFVQRLNITSLFSYNTVSVKFTDAGTGLAGSYSFVNPGNAPLFVAPTGSYSFFENGASQRLKLVGTSRTDSIDFAKAYRVSDNKLALRYNRAYYTGSKKIFIYYDFNFSRN
jgi:hypothetical protein